MLNRKQIRKPKSKLKQNRTQETSRFTLKTEKSQSNTKQKTKIYIKRACNIKKKAMTKHSETKNLQKCH